jgi:DNA-binding NarL/FixJ family response regulator
LHETKNRIAVVLLVQGDPNLLNLTKRCLLLQEGIIVETAISADEAFNKVATIKPDVIVCDLSCSYKNSFDFLKKLREDGTNTPFIGLAYDDEKDLVRKALDLGASGYLIKSCDVSPFFEALKKLIDSNARSHGSKY